MTKNPSWFFVCVACADYAVNTDHEVVARESAEHICRRRTVWSGAEHTMRPFEEAVWVTQQLKQMGRVPV